MALASVMNFLILAVCSTAYSFFDFSFAIVYCTEFSMFANGSFKDASYSGGGIIKFIGTLGADTFTARLFQGEILLGNSPVYVTYSVSIHLSIRFRYTDSYLK